MLQGIEVQQSTKPDAWVILMNQPFAGLVKELFEPQVYPHALAAALRRHRLDAAVSDGRGGARHDDSALGDSSAIR